MSESRTNSDDYLSDCWLTSWEQNTLEEIERGEESHHKGMTSETDASIQRTWNLFQNAAQCVAIMYKGATDQQPLWVQFQTAAGNITSLYKESVDNLRRCSDAGIQHGYQKRNREIASWAKRRRHIRRDELFAFLAGKSPPPSQRSSHLRNSPRTRLSLDRMSPRLPSNQSSLGHEDNLSTFREALGIHAPMTAPNFAPRRRSSTHLPELQSFIVDEFARHKRPAPTSSPPHDVTMDSPQHKKARFT